MSPDMEIDSRRIDQLDDEVTHLAKTVNSLAIGQSSITTSVEGLATAFKDFSRDIREEIRQLTRDAQPKPVSVTNWIVVLFALLGLLGSVMFGVQAYVEGTLAPVRATVAELKEDTDANRERLFSQAKQDGYRRAQIEALLRKSTP